MISKPTPRKRRPPATAPETWAKLEGLSIKLNQVLQDLFEAMRQPSPGGHAPEFSISWIADLAKLPPAIEAPARQKPVRETPKSGKTSSLIMWFSAPSRARSTDAG